jgi:polysaccharide biosynthesis/export protein
MRVFLPVLLAVVCGLAPVTLAAETKAETVPVVELLGPGDRLRFQILEDGDPARELVVSREGQLDVPYLGVVSVEGYSAATLQTWLAEALEVDYYVKATVRLQRLDAGELPRHRGRVFVTGQVRRVGLVEIDTRESNTLSKIILANGGLADFADDRRIRIVRNLPGGEVETLVVDLREVLQRGRIDRDVPVLDGDLIVVDARLVNW